MCTQSCLDFISGYLTEDEVRGKSVLEVGSLDVNGSARQLVTRLGPAGYVGVDMELGPGVDEVCSAEGLIERFGAAAFDIVVSTEMLEHVFDWRKVMRNLKGIVKPGGLLLVTTRSIGFGYHAYPYDFWRYQLEDMRVLFADFCIIELIDDPLSPGVFVKASRPATYKEANLDQHSLYSMITRRRSVNVSEKQIAGFHARKRALLPLRALERGIRSVRKRVLGR